MPSKKKVAEKKICPAKIIYCIEEDEGWDGEEEWYRVGALPTLTKTGKMPKIQQWEDNVYFRTAAGAQVMVDALTKHYKGNKYRVAQLVLR